MDLLLLAYILVYMVDSLNEKKFRKNFGENVKKYRNELGLVQEKFAEKVGIAIGTISTIESGHNFPSSPNIIALAKGLNQPVYKLFVFDEYNMTIEDPELQSILVDAFKGLTLKQRKVALKLVKSVSEMDLN